MFVQVTFQLANFIDYICAWIRQGDFAYHGRVDLVGGGWRATLDARRGLDGVKERLARDGGYASTHPGRLEQADGFPFSREAAIDAQRARSG